MADLDLTFAEELSPADDVLGRRWLVQQLAHPDVRRRERRRRPAEVTRELLDGAATGISIKTSRTGFTAQPADPRPVRGHGRRGLIGNQIDTQIGSLCAAAFGAAHRLTARRAAELSNFLDMSDDLLAEPLVIEDGELASARAPGSASSIDEDKLTRYRQRPVNRPDHPRTTATQGAPP